MKYFFVFAWLLLSWKANGQPEVNVEVSADTIELGKSVEITYTIQNGDGKFELPSLDSLPLISGPNSSSSFMYQNGEQSYSQSYSFILLGLEEGKIKVPEATYRFRNEELTIEPVEIMVVATLDSAKAPTKKSKKGTIKSKREKKIF